MARRTQFQSGQSTTLAQSLPWLFLILGIVALLASILLSIEVFDRLKNPAYVPVCDLNPVLSCTSVADSQQSHLFGFPNYFIGIAGFAAVATIGAAMMAGAKFRRHFWQIVEVGMLGAFLFITWLQFETLYRIGALCLYCMITWACTGPLFWYTTLFNVRSGNLKVPKKLQRAVEFCQRHHADILILWFVLIIGLILKRFWYYWSTHLF